MPKRGLAALARAGDPVREIEKDRPRCPARRRSREGTPSDQALEHRQGEEPARFEEASASQAHQLALLSTNAGDFTTAIISSRTSSSAATRLEVSAAIAHRSSGDSSDPLKKRSHSWVN